MEAILKPFREVVHIHHQTGARGGRVWFLTLACGHHKAVRMPRIEMARGDAVPIWTGKKPPRRKKLEAPFKCRCLICPPSDTTA